MCGPAAAVLGIVGNLAGAAIGAAGAQQEADAQAAARERQAQIREINAISRREQAVSRADLKEDEHEQLIAAQDVAAAGNGIVVGGGSFDDLKAGAIKNQYLDVQNIIHTGETEAIDEENQARSDRAAAADIRKSGKIKATSSILGGLAGAAKGIATQIA
jgi:hypothetical protein